MAPPGGLDLTLTVHGLRRLDGKVFADTLVQKLDALVRGLKLVDGDLNGANRHDFIVEHLEIGSALVAVREIPPVKGRADSPSRALTAYGRQIMLGSASPESISPELAKIFAKLTKGVSDRFDHATLEYNAVKDSTVRVDRFFRENLDRIELSRTERVESATPTFFVGHAWGAFQGSVQEFDNRQRQSLLPEGHFILSAGGKDIPCIFYLPVEEVSASFGRPSVVEGQAIYDGKSGFPARLEVRSIRLIEGESFIPRRGTVAPYEIPEDPE
jgi:hypothetical protein